MCIFVRQSFTYTDCKSGYVAQKIQFRTKSYMINYSWGYRYCQIPVPNTLSNRFSECGLVFEVWRILSQYATEIKTELCCNLKSCLLRKYFQIHETKLWLYMLKRKYTSHFLCTGNTIHGINSMFQIWAPKVITYKT